MIDTNTKNLLGCVLEYTDPRNAYLANIIKHNEHLLYF